MKVRKVSTIIGGAKLQTTYLFLLHGCRKDAYLLGPSQAVQQFGMASTKTSCAGGCLILAKSLLSH